MECFLRDLGVVWSAAWSCMDLSLASSSHRMVALGLLRWQTHHLFLPQQSLSSDCSSVHGCLETPGEPKEPRSVLLDSLVLQGVAGLQPQVMLMFSLDSPSGMKSFSERLSSPISSTDLLRLKLLLRGAFFSKILAMHGKAVLPFCSGVKQE